MRNPRVSVLESSGSGSQAKTKCRWIWASKRRQTSAKTRPTVKSCSNVAWLPQRYSLPKVDVFSLFAGPSRKTDVRTQLHRPKATRCLGWAPAPQLAVDPGFTHAAADQVAHLVGAVKMNQSTHCRHWPPEKGGMAFVPLFLCFF